MKKIARKSPYRCDAVEDPAPERNNTTTNNNYECVACGKSYDSVDSPLCRNLRHCNPCFAKVLIEHSKALLKCYTWELYETVVLGNELNKLHEDVYRAQESRASEIKQNLKEIFGEDDDEDEQADGDGDVVFSNTTEQQPNLTPSPRPPTELENSLIQTEQKYDESFASAVVAGRRFVTHRLFMRHVVQSNQGIDGVLHDTFKRMRKQAARYAGHKSPKWRGRTKAFVNLRENTMVEKRIKKGF